MEVKTHAIQILESHMEDLDPDGMVPAAIGEAIAALTVVKYIKKFNELRMRPTFWKSTEGWGAACGGPMNGPLVGPCPSLLDALVQLYREATETEASG